jgi:hypothetical protein
MIETVVSQQSIVVTHNTQSVCVGQHHSLGRIHAYRRESLRMEDDNPDKKTVVEGLATDRELERVKQGKKGEAPSTSEPLLGIGVVLEGTTEKLREEGIDAWKPVKEPFTHATQGKPFEVLCGNFTTRYMETLKGEIIPVALNLSGEGYRFTNGEYDLPKAVKILRAREDVKLWESFGQAIFDLPAYACSRGEDGEGNSKDKQIRFTWIPSQTQTGYLHTIACRAPDWLCSGEKLVWAIFETDMLGLRAGGAARSLDYFGREPLKTDREKALEIARSLLSPEELLALGLNSEPETRNPFRGG